jgi:hypothetical protein
MDHIIPVLNTFLSGFNRLQNVIEYINGLNDLNRFPVQILKAVTEKAYVSYEVRLQWRISDYDISSVFWKNKSLTHFYSALEYRRKMFHFLFGYLEGVTKHKMCAKCASYIYPHILL